MSEPTTTVERDGVPIDIYDQSGTDRVTVATGSYGPEHPRDQGMVLTLNYHYVGEAPDDVVADELAALRAVALDRALDHIEAHNAAGELEPIPTPGEFVRLTGGDATYEVTGYETIDDQAHVTVAGKDEPVALAEIAGVVADE